MSDVPFDEMADIPFAMSDKSWSLVVNSKIKLSGI
jgi:hypothetical protein